MIGGSCRSTHHVMSPDFELPTKHRQHSGPGPRMSYGNAQLAFSGHHRPAIGATLSPALASPDPACRLSERVATGLLWGDPFDQPDKGFTAQCGCVPLTSVH